MKIEKYTYLGIILTVLYGYVLVDYIDFCNIINCNLSK